MSLSTVLFALFMDGLAAELRKQGLGVDMDGRKLQTLLFADDVVIVADTPENLQRMINVVAEYSRSWRFEEHIGKCAVLTIASRSADEATEWVSHGKRETETRNKHWTFRGQRVPTSDRYKYLGLWFRNDLSWSLHAQEMANKGKEANRKLRGGTL